MDKMRRPIYILDGSVAVTGALISAREMARAFKQDCVLVLPAEAAIPVEYLRSFSRVERLPIRPLRKNLKDILLYVPALLFTAVRLRYLMWRDQSDLLLVNDFYLIQGALIRLTGFRGRILAWVRIDPAVFGSIGRVWLWLSDKAADSVICVSMFIRSRLPPSISGHVLYDPVSTEFLIADASIDTKSRTFVYVGNYIRGKGQDTALEALALVRRVLPDVNLEFYGGDMGLEKNRAFKTELEAQATVLGISEGVTFGGFSNDPRLVLAGKLAALNFSLSESFSRTVLEASASGLPVIATRCGGPEEILEEGATGFLVPVGDAASCAERMIALCRSTELTMRLGQAGRARVMKQFSPDLFREQITALCGLSAKDSPVS